MNMIEQNEDRLVYFHEKKANYLFNIVMIGMAVVSALGGLGLLADGMMGGLALAVIAVMFLALGILRTSTSSQTTIAFERAAGAVIITTQSGDETSTETIPFGEIARVYVADDNFEESKYYSVHLLLHDDRRIQITKWRTNVVPLVGGVQKNLEAEAVALRRFIG
jgi:hypothetical protein